MTLGSVLVVTGTGTGVGKTVVTAALAAIATADGRRVAVLKPAQTGVAPGERGDIDEVRRLTGGADSPVTCVELARYPDPLAPATAARSAGLAPVTPADAARCATELAADHALVVVEGAGGLLVRMCDDPPATIADVAGLLAAPVLVVAAAGLGTLNHAALTTEALAARGLRCLGVVIGSWPAEPDLASRHNIVDLPVVTGVPLLGRIPAGMPALAPAEFRSAAGEALSAARHVLVG